jgi:hypothetical protein
MLVQAGPKDVHESLKEALNIIDQAFNREKEALASIRFFIKQDPVLEGMLKAKVNSLESLRPAFLRDLEETYRLRCRGEKIEPRKPVRSEAEIRLGKWIPVRTEKMRGYFNAWEFYQKVREMKVPPSFRIGRAEFEVRNFIDGRRSILDIRNAVSAESGPVPLEGVENYVLLLEKTGFVRIEKKT